MSTTTRPRFRSIAALLGFGLLVIGAQAKIVVIDPTDLTIPTGGQVNGYYFDLATGAFSQDYTLPELAGANLQLYRATGTIPTLRMAANNTHDVDGWVGSSIVGPFSLDPDTLVGPGSSFVKVLGSTGVGAYRQDRTGYLGLRFLNSTTGKTNYGWMEIVTATTPSYSAVMTRWAYEDTGASITTGQTQPVPEPATFAVFGLGAVALLRRRRSVQA